MKLLKLTSSNPKFRTIEFKSGLNIVVGTQLTKEQKKSINGIGKSMSLNLIHYIFGASFKSDSEKKLEKFLAGYGDFILTFSHKDKDYTIKKNFAQSEYYINNEEVKKTNYPKKLNAIFMGSETSKPSFKQVFNCFARRYSSQVSYYSNNITQQGRNLEDYDQRFTNLFLLGLDMTLVRECHAIKEKITKLEKTQKVINEYKIELDNSNLNDIKDELKKLSVQFESFRIHENFDLLKKEADDLTEKMRDFRNQIYDLENTLARKEKSFETSKNTKVDIEKIENLFNEASFFFNEKVTKRLVDAQNFHEQLIENRKKRLKLEIKTIKSQLIELELKKNETGIKRDKLLKDLNNSGALEERDSIKDRMATLKSEKADLERYERLLAEFKLDKSKLELKKAKNKAESIVYLENSKSHIEDIEEQFRALVKRFYDNKGGSFNIDEAKDAKYLFDIIASVPKEGSQGVGEVKIFCYDILLFLLNKELLGFLAHDGCIFSEMDPRQKSTIFKVVLELTKEFEFQYFVNIGDNSLSEIYNTYILTEQDKQDIKKSIRLELSDKEPKDWLFGIGFD